MSRLMNRQRGFTLIELLIVIAIIGIIAAILIPNFLDSLQKAKQKRTMGDMRDVGTAWFAWLTDQFGGAAAAGQAQTYSLPTGWSGGQTELEETLVPQYIQEVPLNDAWNNALVFHRVGDDDLLRATNVMAIQSPGRDGVDDLSGTVDPGAFDPTDYDEDILWADGFFVRYPQKTDSGAGGGS